MNALSIVTRVLALSVITGALSACVVPKIHRLDAVEPGTNGVTALSVDAKQRVVVFSRSADANGYAMTCAEPSPDALSALSSGVGFGAEYAKIMANLAISQSESAASIGLRTQSIQLLRDEMYRLCEAYAAQAIDKEEFNRRKRLGIHVLLT
jgi:hypothetical protein